jgi:molybdopterin molybdotransferase
LNKLEIYKYIKNHIELCQVEKVSALEAIGRVSAERLEACIDIPNSNKAKYDGFAIHLMDYEKINYNHNSTQLKIIGSLGAGHCIQKELLPGTTINIMTGAEVPNNTAYVVPSEFANVISQEEVIIKKINPILDTIDFKGENCKKGQLVLDKNKIIDRNTIFDITNQGFKYIKVYKKPRVVILSTGDEISKIGTPYKRGIVYNSTSYAIAADIINHGGEVIIIDHLLDNIDEIVKGVEKFCKEADMVITTGGIAKGKFDYTKFIHKYIPTNILFMERDKPPRIIVSKLQDKWIINLSGSPRATFVSLEHVVIPILKTMLGILNKGERKYDSCNSRRV